MDENTKSTVIVNPTEGILENQYKPKVSLSSGETWIPDKAKGSYHEQRLGQSKWAFRLSFGFLILL